MSTDRQQYNKAYMGISLGSRQFSVRYIRNVILYAGQKFDDLLVVIADRPHIYTFMAIKNYDHATAEARALEIGAQKLRSVQRAISAVGDVANRVTICRWDDLARSSAFDMFQEGVAMLYDVDDRFKRDICDVFEEHLSTGNYGTVAPDQRVLGQNYILQEFAMMLYLQECRGFYTQLSPAEAPSFLIKYCQGKYCESKGLPSVRDLHHCIHSMCTLGARKHDFVSVAHCRESAD